MANPYETLNVATALDRALKVSFKFMRIIFIVGRQRFKSTFIYS